MSNTREEGAIRQTLQYFFDGLDNLDARLIRKAFYAKAWSYCITADGAPGGMSVNEWDRMIEEIKRNPDHPYVKERSKKNILYMDVTGNCASAKVEWVFSYFMFTDYYNLLRIGGRWYITSKVYQATVFNDAVE
jgi:hypothetical protein